jgi:hypothetical protein
MIIPQNSTPSVFVGFTVGATLDNVRIGKADGNLAGFGGTTSPQADGLLKVNLAAGDTDIIGAISIVLLNAASEVIGIWYGVVLAAYPSTGDPLSSATPAAYPVGSAGYRIGNNLDQPVSTRLPTTSYTSPDNSQIVANGMQLANIISGLTTGSYLIQLTSTQFDALIAAVWQTADQIETGFTSQAALRLILSAAAAKLGIVGTVVKIRDVNDTKDRITATTDAIGQRTAVTTNVS